MCCVSRQIFRQIDDFNRLERALLYTDTTSHAHGLTDVGDFILFSHSYTDFLCLVHRTESLAFKLALVRLTFIRIHNGDTMHSFLRHCFWVIKFQDLI